MLTNRVDVILALWCSASFTISKYFCGANINIWLLYLQVANIILKITALLQTLQKALVLCFSIVYMIVSCASAVLLYRDTFGPCTLIHFPH